jgi:hypothetical protein
MTVMPRPKSNPQILELAKRGAEVQLRELVQEIKNLVDLFPHLSDSFDRDELPLRFVMARDAGVATKKNEGPRRRRRMSAVARRAVSARMKKYWAARRSAGKKG